MKHLFTTRSYLSFTLLVGVACLWILLIYAELSFTRRKYFYKIVNKMIGVNQVDFDLIIGWRSVGDIYHTYVYSAIYDDVEEPVIRVMTATREDRPAYGFICNYYSRVGGTSRMRGSVHLVREPKWGYKYRSAMIKCRLPNGKKPTSVSISDGFASNLHIPLDIVYDKNTRRTLTECFSALHSNFSDVTQLIQTMEWSLMQGVQHFVVYVHSVNEAMLSALRLYEGLGILTMMKWNIPFNSSEMHYFGQLIALQDCLYRHLHNTEYIITGDTDEIYVPRLDDSLIGIIRDYNRTTRACSCIVVRSMFFPLNYPVSAPRFKLRDEAKSLNLTFLLHTTHLRVHSHFDRSKLIYKPKDVEVVGIHGVEVYREGKVGCKCPPKLCLLHHYRDVPRNEWGSFRHRDDTLLYHARTYISRISKRLKLLKTLEE